VLQRVSRWVAVCCRLAGCEFVSVQCVAVCCSVCCSVCGRFAVRECILERVNVLQCVLQCVAVCCYVRLGSWVQIILYMVDGVAVCVAVCCSVQCRMLQYVCSSLYGRLALHTLILSSSIYMALQHTATHCNTLQHTATH